MHAAMIDAPNVRNAARAHGPLTGQVRGGAAGIWRAEPLLAWTGLALLAALAPSLAGLWLDPRVIAGAPAWLKPAKFAASTGVYALTLAWVLTYLSDWPRTRRIAGRTTAIVLVLEVAIIDAQAWRGTTSHFNVGTMLDGVLFSIMGVGILIQTMASAAVGLALWRQPFADRAFGWALRLGMAVTLAGACVGGLMTQPTDAQLADVRTTGRIVTAGAHSVGGPDGGPGLPGTGWSTQHGDLRVPHFVGLHAIQVLPLLAFLFRRREPAARLRLTLATAAAYTAVFGLLLAQALQGIPVLRGL